MAQNKFAEYVALQRRILPYATNLERLQLSCPNISHILEIIVLLSASGCKVIKIHVDVDLGDGEANWIALDAALAQERFRNLRQFSVVELSEGSLITPEVRLLMPLSNARRILN